MAVITSLKSGLYGTGATWVGLVAPVEGDSVVIANTGTGAETFSTDATGYAIGSTIITLTGAVAAGSFVVNESVQFGSDPNYYNITAWVSATKTLTVSALIVAIPASATLVKNRGHVITVDGTYTAGDDTATAFTVNGTLKASRTVNNSLTIKGQLLTAATIAAGIDYGTSGDPIPAGVTAALILNKSAAMADRKWGLNVADKARFFAYGNARQVNTTLQSGIAVSATSAVVLDATGWAIGDKIIFAETDGDSGHYELITITGLTPGSGTTATITFSACSYAHAAACPVGNFSSNVTISCYGSVYTSSTYSAYINTAVTNAAGNNIRQWKYVAFLNITSVAGSTQQTIGGDGTNTATPWISVDACSWYGSPGQSNIVLYAYDSSLLLNNLAVFASGYTGGIYLASGSNPTINNTVVYGAYINLQSDYGPGGCGFTLNDCKLWDGFGGGIPFRSGASFNATLNRCQMHVGLYGILFIYGTIYLNSCNLFDSSLPGSPGVTNLISISANACGIIVATNCKFPASWNLLNLALANPSFQFWIVNRNADVTLQDLYVSTGEWHRDNSVFSRGKSSLRLDTKTALSSSYPAVAIPAPNGVAVTIKVRMRKNSSYGASTLPTATLSGLGITPVVATLTNSVDTWEDFTLTATQSSGDDGNLSLIFTGQSSSASGVAYFDGIPFTPFVTAVDHYGYTYDITNVVRTVDPIISVATEATVAAYTGISISAGTITLTSNHTVRELYDYCQYYRAVNHLAPFFTSGDGVNFTSTYDLVLNNAQLTGSGVINMPVNTLTLTGTGDSTIQIKASNGTRTSITIANIITGSRVQIYNVTDSSELYNGVPGTSQSLNVTWTSDKSIRIRIKQTGASTAYLMYTANGTLGQNGLAITASQVVDTVYATNGINGSTVSECSISGATVRIYVNDPTANQITFQRIYNWYQYILQTSTGIANQDTTYFYAISSVEYRFKSTMKIINQDTVNPLTIIGANVAPDSGVATIFDTSNGASISLYSYFPVDASGQLTDMLTTTNFMGLK